MAVKVMLAPAIAKAAAAVSAPKPAEPKPKRRRSSVYDADGNEVFITLLCLKCKRVRPLSQFGLRKMADGAIRNQPWCRTCRSDASSRRPRHDAARDHDGSAAEALAGYPISAPEEKPLDTGTLAAQVVAALHGGRR